jgi:hypothetical protein
LTIISLGYSKQSILKKPVNMGTSISIPARNILQPPDDTVPIPRAYGRAKEFLKIMLRNEVELIQRSPGEQKDSSIQTLGVHTIIDEFRKQLIAYVQGNWPFDVPHGGNTLEWWERVKKHPHARVLAVRIDSSRQVSH